MSAPIDAALDYASRGLRVLPLHTADDHGRCSCGRPRCASVAKHPRSLHGVKDATADAGEVLRWWGMWPSANVGIATGEGLAVLDVDPRNGGHETLAAFIDNVAFGDAPETAEAVTGGDGRHLYLRAPRDLGCAVLGDGLDLKANGGYIVAPPSLHASGRQYVWHPARGLGDTPLADAPAWVLDRAGHREGGRRQAVPPDEWVRIVRHGADLGERNTTAARLAGRLLAHGLDAHLVLALVETWDERRNRPPLGAAEVAKTVRSIAAREAAKLEGRTP